MSLINDALKKAARQRAEEQGEVIPPMPGGGHRRPSRPGEPMRVQTIVLIGAAALALIVVSAVVTGIFVTGKPEVKAAAVAQAPTLAPTPPPQKVAVQSPIIAAPQALPTSVPTPTSAPVAVVMPAVVAAAAPTAAPTPRPVAAALAPIAAPAAAPTTAPQSRNELIQGIVDRFRVSGVRAAGADSKALVDGHVYKINEMIDRTIGLRLVKVDADHLTFVDAQGDTYVKSF
jgi:hypothetical protein